MAVDMFLKLDGVQGDGIKGEIEVLSFSWGVTNQTSGQPGGGGGAGKPIASDFSIVKELDKTSPHLMEMVCTGKHSSSATLSLRKAGGKQQEYLKITMSDVLISSYQTSGANSGVPMEQVSFSFQDIALQTLNEKGQFEAATSCNFAGGKH